MADIVIKTGKKMVSILAGFFAGGKTIPSSRDKTTVSDEESLEALDLFIRSL